MNAQDLLDYSLGLLDDARRQPFEHQMAANPALAEQLECLRRQIALLVDDGEEIEPPPDLARRTLSFVADRSRRRTFLDLVPVRVPFRWADVAVAASIFLAGLLVLVPAIKQGKDRMNQAACTWNLQRLGRGLTRYAVAHGHYPFVAAGSPVPYAGTFAVALHDEGLLPDAAPLQCPSCNHAHPHRELPDFSTLSKMQAQSPGWCRHMIDGDYAYHLGYHHETGRPGPIPADPPSATIPLLADQPPYDAQARILEGNSPNHGGVGQNVLFSDGHVSFRRTRWVSPVDRDLYLNDANRPAMGLHPQDAVLIPATFRTDVR